MGVREEKGGKERGSGLPASQELSLKESIKGQSMLQIPTSCFCEAGLVFWVLGFGVGGG